MVTAATNVGLAGYTEHPTTFPPGARLFQRGQLIVLVSRETMESGRSSWHLSISHPGRCPTWEEIRQARYTFLPHDVTMAMLLPPPEQYVNLHTTCFHLWQLCAKCEEGG